MAPLRFPPGHIASIWDRIRWTDAPESSRRHEPDQYEIWNEQLNREREAWRRQAERDARRREGIKR